MFLVARDKDPDPVQIGNNHNLNISKIIHQHVQSSVMFSHHQLNEPSSSLILIVTEAVFSFVVNVSDR